MTSGASPADAEGRGPETASDPPSGFAGRGGWHLVAFLAALALILAMSIDWYSTEQGEEFRRVEENAPSARQVDPELDEQAARAAEAQEKTAWQADALIDRLILVACLGAFLAAVVAAFMRSAGRPPEPPWNPSAIATIVGLSATLLILYRMIQPPGINEAAVIKSGAPIGLVAVGVLTIGSRLAVLGEREEREERAGVAAPAKREEPEPAAEPEVAEPTAPSRWSLRRRRKAKEEPATAATGAAEAEPDAAAGIDFDFPAAPPPAAEEIEPSSAPLEEEPAFEPEPPPVAEEPPAFEHEPPPAAEGPFPVSEEPPPPLDEPAAFAEPEAFESEEARAEALWHQAADEAADAPPVDQTPAGAESPEEAPPWREPLADEEPSAVEDEPLADDEPPPVAEEPLAVEEEPPPVEEEPPVEDEAPPWQEPPPVEEEPLADEEPVAAVDPLAGEEPPVEEELPVDDEPLAAESVPDEPLEGEVLADEPDEALEEAADEERPAIGGWAEVEVESEPVSEPLVDDSAAEEPPVESPEDELPLGEEIEFESEPETPDEPEPRDGGG